jgi:DNA repair exonuclease SbcCD nuclease subunit
MMSTYQASGKKNIVVLHGELREYGGADGSFGINDLDEAGADYFALGHYHAYSAKHLSRGGAAVYCGTPEGRGFDEVGQCGFVLIDTDGDKISHKFIPFAKRMQIICPVDVSGAESNSQIESLIASAVSSYGRENLIRIQLCGEREPALKLNTDIIKSRFAGSFFYFEIKDKTKLKVDRDALRYDKSLRGEFLRLCLEDYTISEDERQKIIDCGLAALSGDSWEVTE